MEKDWTSYLPLTETTFFILVSLANGPRHGYAILKDVSALSNNRITLSTGTLYGALKRLMDEDWIVRQEREERQEGVRDRKVYILSGPGKNLLMAEIKRLQSLVRVAEKVRAES